MRSVLVVIFLVACSMNDQGKSVTMAPDAGRWQLLEVDGNPAEAAAEGWLEIDLALSQITGTAGCNHFVAGFEGSPENLTMGRVGGTKMMCPEPIMAQERRVYEILSAAQSISVDTDGMLKISGAKGYLRGALKQSEP